MRKRWRTCCVFRSGTGDQFIVGPRVQLAMPRQISSKQGPMFCVGPCSSSKPAASALQVLTRFPPEPNGHMSGRIWHSEGGKGRTTEARIVLHHYKHHICPFTLRPFGGEILGASIVIYRFPAAELGRTNSPTQGQKGLAVVSRVVLG